MILPRINPNSDYSLNDDFMVIFKKKLRFLFFILKQTDITFLKGERSLPLSRMKIEKCENVDLRTTEKKAQQPFHLQISIKKDPHFLKIIEW